MLDLSPNDPLIKTYLKDLQHLKSQFVTHELGLKGPFQNLLDKAARRRGWTLVPELSTYSGGKRVVPDGTSATSSASPAAGGRPRTPPTS